MPNTGIIRTGNYNQKTKLIHERADQEEMKHTNKTKERKTRTHGKRIGSDR